MVVVFPAPLGPSKPKTSPALISRLIHAQPAALAVAALVHFLEANSNALLDLHIAQPTLEDVFVEMTGRRMEDL